MKIYVDGEMPINIVQRVIHCEDGDLCGIELLFNSSDINKREKNSLHPVAEREAEVRKEVVEEIKKGLNKFTYLMCSLEHPTMLKYGVPVEDIVSILDQVERGNSDEINND